MLKKRILKTKFQKMTNKEHQLESCQYGRYKVGFYCNMHVVKRSNVSILSLVCETLFIKVECSSVAVSSKHFLKY